MAIIAFLTFTVKQSITKQMDGVTREMLLPDIDRFKADIVAGIKNDFADVGKEIIDIEITFSESFP